MDRKHRDTWPSGDAAEITYDDAGRVSTVETPSGTSSVAYSPASGQIASSTSEDGETSTFDFDGPLPTRITQAGAAAGTIDFAYDGDLNLSSLTAPGGATAYEYDRDGLVTKAGALTISRSAASGRVTGMTLDATATTRTYNSFSEPLTESTTLPGSSLYSETYTRDAIGRIAAKTETAPSGSTTTYAYTYDPAGHLTEVTKNGNPYRAYAFDANGNRTQTTRQTPSGPAAEPATYDAQDKQVASGAFDLTYNANGELTSKTNRDTSAAQTYEYSTLGALQSVTTAGGNEIAYKYDAQGNRVEARTDGEPTQRLIYAPGLLGPVAELATAGHAETRFVYASRVNVPDYMVRGGRTFRLVTDQLGSVRFVVDSTTGEIAQEIAYDPFGEVISDSAPGFQPFGFAGGLYDSATGLTHFGAREYDAGLGRWTSRDPISFAGGDGNLYGYVLQDPVNFLDPNGLYGLGDAWSDFTGTLKEMPSVAWQHRGAIITATGVVVCVASAGAACAALIALNAVNGVGTAAWQAAHQCYGAAALSLLGAALPPGARSATAGLKLAADANAAAKIVKYSPQTMQAIRLGVYGPIGMASGLFDEGASSMDSATCPC